MNRSLDSKLQWSSWVLEAKAVLKMALFIYIYIYIYPYMIHIYLIFTLHFQYLKLGLQKNEAGLKGGLQWWRFTRKYIYIYIYIYIFFFGVLPKTLVYTG